MLFNETYDQFGIFFTKAEFELAYKLLTHIRGANQEDMDLILEMMDTLDKVANKQPILRLVKDE